MTRGRYCTATYTVRDYARTRLLFALPATYILLPPFSTYARYKRGAFAALPTLHHTHAHLAALALPSHTRPSFLLPHYLSSNSPVSVLFLFDGRCLVINSCTLHRISHRCWISDTYNLVRRVTPAERAPYHTRKSGERRDV